MAWSKSNNAIVLLDNQINYLNILASKLPFDIVVTSGFRTPRAQAAAMFTKIELGDDLIALYLDDRFAQDVIDAYPDLDAAEQAVKDYVARGGGKRGHLSGNAVDIRTRDKTQQEINLILSTVEQMGDDGTYEAIPPHIDIVFINDYSVDDNSNESKKKLIIPILLIVGGVLWITT